MHETNKTEPVRVEVSMGFTRNMGNFESLRIDVGISDSARPGESAAQATERIYAFVEKKLVEKFSDTEAALEAQKS